MKGFCGIHLNNDLFKKILLQIEAKGDLMGWSRIDLDTSSGYVSGFVDEKETRILGLLAFNIEYKLPNRKDVLSHKVVFKSKSRGFELELWARNIVSDFKDEVIETYINAMKRQGMFQSDFTEVECYRSNEVGLKTIMQDCHWSWIDEANDIFVVCMDFIDPKQYTHVRTTSELNVWKESDMMKALDGIAITHANFYGRTADIPIDIQKHMHDITDRKIIGIVPGLKKLLQDVQIHSPDFVNEKARNLIVKSFDHLNELFDILDASPKTFVHNDFSSRNLCLRREVPKGKHHLCLYDWELANIGPAQYDIAKFMAFSFPVGVDAATWNKYVGLHCSYLKNHLGENVQSFQADLETDNFQKVFAASVLHFLLFQLLPIGELLDTKIDAPFLQQAVITTTDYLHEMSDQYSFLK